MTLLVNRSTSGCGSGNRDTSQSDALEADRSDALEEDNPGPAEEDSPGPAEDRRRSPAERGGVSLPGAARDGAGGNRPGRTHPERRGWCRRSAHR